MQKTEGDILLQKWDIWCTPFTLAESGDKRAVDALLKTVETFLRTENISSKALQAVKALGDYRILLASLNGLPEALATSVTDVNHKSANSATERVVDMLKAVIYKRSDRKSRRAAVMALQKIGTEKAVDALLEALVGESKNLRQHAQNVLVKMGTEILPRMNTLAAQVEGKARSAVERIIEVMSMRNAQEAEE